MHQPAAMASLIVLLAAAQMGCTTWPEQDADSVARTRPAEERCQAARSARPVGSPPPSRESLRAEVLQARNRGELDPICSYL